MPKSTGKNRAERTRKSMAATQVFNVQPGAGAYVSDDQEAARNLEFLDDALNKVGYAVTGDSANIAELNRKTMEAHGWHRKPRWYKVVLRYLREVLRSLNRMSRGD